MYFEERDNSENEMHRWVFRISYFVFFSFPFFNSNKTIWPVFNWERVGSVSARLQMHSRRVSTKLRYTTSEYCTQTQPAEVPYYSVSFTSFLFFSFFLLPFLPSYFPFFLCVFDAGRQLLMLFFRLNLFLPASWWTAETTIKKPCPSSAAALDFCLLCSKDTGVLSSVISWQR